MLTPHLYTCVLMTSTTMTVMIMTHDTCIWDIPVSVAVVSFCHEHFRREPFPCGYLSRPTNQFIIKHLRLPFRHTWAWVCMGWGWGGFDRFFILVWITTMQIHRSRHWQQLLNIHTETDCILWLYEVDSGNCFEAQIKCEWNSFVIYLDLINNPRWFTTHVTTIDTEKVRGIFMLLFTFVSERVHPCRCHFYTIFVSSHMYPENP